MIKNYNIIFILLGLSLFSCGENVIEEPDSNFYGYDFYPVEVGYSWEYEVDSVLILQGGSNNRVSTSYVKEEISELISESGDEKVYKILRSFRPNQNVDWELKDVWQVSIDDDRAIKTEENLKFIKLVFPAKPGERWDGNAFFDSDKEFSVAANQITIYQNWRYKIEAIDLMKTYNGDTYQDVLHVSHIDEDDEFISRRFSEEFYAKGVGLVERNMEIFESQEMDNSQEWVDRADEGFQLNQRLISFSKN